jgi:alkaline phosphatase D
MQFSMKKLLLILLVLKSVTGFSQKGSEKPKEKYSPVFMLGYVDFREANVWMMDQKSWSEIQYWDLDQPNNKIVVKARTSKQVNTHYVYDFRLGPLDPGKKYAYKYFVQGKKDDSNEPFYTFETPALWKWRGPAPDFKIAMGSCYYANQPEHDRPGKPYGDTATGIFDQITQKDPDMMLWLGDNIYLREPDWGSETGIQERYVFYRNQQSTKKLLTYCPNLAIWDDHDFGPNDANGSYYNKQLTLNAFKTFWPNTGNTIKGVEGITYAFDYQDAHFFMLDDRYNRTPNYCDSCVEETILGKAQLEWFKTSLLTLPKSDIKVVAIGGQFLNSVKDFECYRRWEWEYNDIISFIQNNGIKNVIFLTGDRHFSELSILKKEGKPTIYDFTVSPLTSGVFKKVTEINTNRVEGSLYTNDRSFGMIEFTGKEKERKIKFVLYDKAGTEIYHFEYNKE